MLKAIQLGQQLTKNEMKGIKGGFRTICACNNGALGRWEYTTTNLVPKRVTDADMAAYCPDGGSCGIIQ